MALKGHIPWNKGIARKEQTKRKISESHKGKSLSEKHKQKISNTSKGHKKSSTINYHKPKSVVHKRKMSEAHRGEKAYNWKGGIKKLAQRIRDSSKYRIWRLKVFERDKFTCVNCHNIGGILNAHHIKKFYIILKEKKVKTLEEADNCKELWDVNNGVTLCIKCHGIER